MAIKLDTVGQQFSFKEGTHIFVVTRVYEDDALEAVEASCEGLEGYYFMKKELDQLKLVKNNSK